MKTLPSGGRSANLEETVDSNILSFEYVLGVNLNYPIH